MCRFWIQLQLFLNSVIEGYIACSFRLHRQYGTAQSFTKIIYFFFLKNCNNRVSDCALSFCTDTRTIFYDKPTAFASDGTLSDTRCHHRLFIASAGTRSYAFWHFARLSMINIRKYSIEEKKKEKFSDFSRRPFANDYAPRRDCRLTWSILRRIRFAGASVILQVCYP